MQIATVTLTDSAAGSVNFLPMIKNNLQVEYKDTSPASAVLYPGLTCSMRPAKGDVARKVSLRVSKPYQYTDANGDTKHNSVVAFIEVVVPDTADGTSIDDLIEFASGAVKEAQFTDAIKNGAFPY